MKLQRGHKTPPQRTLLPSPTNRDFLKYFQVVSEALLETNITAVFSGGVQKERIQQ